jgi:hypothetical protein
VKKNGLKTTGSFDKEIRSSTERNLKIELEII